MVFEFDRECKFCKEHIRIKYSEEYDAYYYPEWGGGWLEKKCKDEDCEFCSIRPLTAKGVMKR